MHRKAIWIFRGGAKFAVLGMLMPLIIYTSCSSPTVANFWSHHDGVLSVICLPYILSMAFDYVKAVDRIETVILLMISANGVIYLFVGLIVSWGRWNLKAHQEEINGTEE